MASKRVSRLDPEGSRAKRARNKACSTQILFNHGFSIEQKNKGLHLIVQKHGVVADFWPTTGQYCVRGVGIYKRGVFNLLNDVEHELEVRSRA